MTPEADPMTPEADTVPPEAPATNSREALQALHRSLATALHQYLIDTPPEKRRASMLGVIRSFLSDNSVHVEAPRRPEATSVPLVSALGEVLEMPFTSDNPDDEPFN